MRVRGTQESIPYIEVGKTEVYIRSNVERVETEEFSGWEYDEQIVSIQEHVATLADQGSVDVTALIISGLMQEIDDLKSRVATLEVLVA
jgi:hypothetical protein